MPLPSKTNTQASQWLMTSYLICVQRSCTYSLQSYDFPHTLRISVPPVTLSFTSYPAFTALFFILIFWIQTHKATFSSFQGVYSEIQISLSLLNPSPQFLHSEAISSFFLSLFLSLSDTHTKKHTHLPPWHYIPTALILNLPE